MQFKTLILRAILFALILAAAASAAAVLFGGGDVAGRVAGTAIMTAVAAIILFFLAIRIDRPGMRNATLVGIACVVAVTLLSFALIWDISTFFTFLPRAETYAELLLATLLATPSIACCLGIMNRPLGRRPGFFGAIAFTLIYAALVVAFLQTSGRATEHVIISCATAAVTALLIMACLTGLSIHVLQAVGIVAALIAWIYLQFVFDTSDRELPFLYTVSITVAVAASYIHLTRFVILKAGQRWIAVLAIVLVVAAAIAIDYAIIDGGRGDELPSRVAAAFAIPAACATLALAIMGAVNRRFTRQTLESDSEFTTLSIICPFCQLKQNAPVGVSSCAGCRLEFNIQVAPPHCRACSYNLLRNLSDRCPECGTPIAPPKQDFVDAAPPPLPS